MHLMGRLTHCLILISYAFDGAPYAMLEPDKVPNRRSLYAFDGAPYALLEPNKLPNRRSLYAFDGAPYAVLEPNKLPYRRSLYAIGGRCTLEPNKLPNRRSLCAAMPVWPYHCPSCIWLSCSEQGRAPQS